MESIFHIDSELNIPIYQQMVDSVSAAIRSGALKNGQKLSTVQEVSQALNIARGTVKRAYDELEHEGLIQKVQGRGTFVSYQQVDTTSRKDQAMAAIDGVLQQLEDMGFTSTEIGIFLDLRLRQRSEQEPQVKVAVVDSNPESLAQIGSQLRRLNHVDLYSYLLEDIQQYPYLMEEDVDLVVTAAPHADVLENILPLGKKLVRVATRLSQGCLAQIIRLKQGRRVGILSGSVRFGQALYQTCQSYAPDVTLLPPQGLGQVAEVESYLQQLQVVLVPEEYERYCDGEVARLLARFEQTGRLISCDYELDEGSFLYLEIKTRRIMEKK